MLAKINFALPLLMMLIKLLFSYFIQSTILLQFFLCVVRAKKLSHASSFVFDGGLFVNLPTINTFRSHRKWDFGCVGFSAMFIEGNTRTCFLYIFSNT